MTSSIKTARRLAGVAGLIVVGSMVCGSPVAAHDLGNTRVHVVLGDDRSIDVRLDVDPDGLIARLEFAAGQAPHTGRLPGPALQAQLRTLASILRGRVSLQFDGVPCPLRVERLDLPSGSWGEQADRPDAPPAMLHLAGRLPPGARTFTWTSSLGYGLFPLVVTEAGHTRAVQWVRDGQSSEPVSLGRSAATGPSAVLGPGWGAAPRYLALGYTHIVPKGLDHILFVVGLCLLTLEWRPLLLQTSAFTLAHSVTLALGLLGLVTISPAIVEPLIALSIAYVAVENVLVTRLTPWRLPVVFGFGLLHGLGFAGILIELGVSGADLVPALVSFNAGVELGQLSVVLVTVTALGLGARYLARDRRYVNWPASVAIAAMGIFWTIQRVL